MDARVFQLLEYFEYVNNYLDTDGAVVKEIFTTESLRDGVAI